MFHILKTKKMQISCETVVITDLRHFKILPGI